MSASRKQAEALSARIARLLGSELGEADLERNLKDFSSRKRSTRPFVSRRSGISSASQKSRPPRMHISAGC
jgi:hypothetical protein